MIMHQGQWGTVCDDSFDSNDNGANVACKQMGYFGGTHLEDSSHSESQTALNIWINGITCSGDESDITHCPGAALQGPGYTGCSHGEDVSVICTGIDNSVLKIEGGGKSGRLMIMHNGQWGTVCDDTFDSNDNGANVACRQMGYSGGVHHEDSSHSESQTALNIWINGINCGGHESDIRSCPSAAMQAPGYAGCSHSEDVSVICH
jgi:hypothetical protein